MKHDTRGKKITRGILLFLGTCVLTLIIRGLTLVPWREVWTVAHDVVYVLGALIGVYLLVCIVWGLVDLIKWAWNKN